MITHLRNVKKDAEGNFYEADHLDGDADMYAIMKELLKPQLQSRRSLPFRPDHRHQMLDDFKNITNPGYSAIGRYADLQNYAGWNREFCVRCRKKVKRIVYRTG